MHPNNSLAYTLICFGMLGIVINMAPTNNPDKFGFAFIMGIGSILFGLYLIGDRIYKTRKYHAAVDAVINSNKYEHSISTIEVHDSFLEYKDSERTYKLNWDTLIGYSMKSGFLFIRHTQSVYDAITLHELAIGKDGIKTLMHFLDEKKVRYIEIL